MTNFQIEHFILNREPTLQAKMRRCVDEIEVRDGEIEAIKDQLDEFSDKLAEAPQENSEMTLREVSSAKKRQDRVTRQVSRSKVKIEKRLAAVSRERKFLSDSLDKYLQVEPMRDWESDTVQAEYWVAKISQEIDFRLSCGMPLDLELVKTAMTLPECRAKVQALTEKKKHLK